MITSWIIISVSYTLAVEEGLPLVEGIFRSEEGDLKSITPPSLLIMSARQESAKHNTVSPVTSVSAHRPSNPGRPAAASPPSSCPPAASPASPSAGPPAAASGNTWREEQRIVKKV